MNKEAIERMKQLIEEKKGKGNGNIKNSATKGKTVMPDNNNNGSVQKGKRNKKTGGLFDK